MPVTFRPAAHAANPLSTKEYTPGKLLETVSIDLSLEVKEILQSSFGPANTSHGNIIPRRNGFVDTVIAAYNTHHALVVRPDDVWIAILGQFNEYVNAHAEELRYHFVAHDDKKELVVVTDGDRYSVDFGWMSRQMAELIAKNVVDPDLRDWIIPSFSTTTVNDKTVSCIIMIATLKAYFGYGLELGCGIPQVTLEGTKADWELLRGKVEKLKTYGVECVAWYHLLVPILDRFVRAFDDPNGPENIDFWQRVAHEHNNGSGPTFLSGWITAFCVFGDKGKWIGHKLDVKQEAPGGKDLAELSVSEFQEVFGITAIMVTDWYPKSLILDGTVYHHTTTDGIPRSIADVDVKLNDNGEIFDTKLAAGMVASEVRSSGDKTLNASGESDTMCPVPGWWMFIKEETPREHPEVIALREIMERFKRDLPSKPASPADTQTFVSY